MSLPAQSRKGAIRGGFRGYPVCRACAPLLVAAPSALDPPRVPDSDPVPPTGIAAAQTALHEVAPPPIEAAPVDDLDRRTARTGQSDR